MKQIFKNQKGFTLIEILLVVAAIAILAGIVIVAINPNKVLGDTRNSQRKADTIKILNAVQQYGMENNGLSAIAIPATPTPICSTTGAACATAGFVDLGVITLNEKYMVAIPVEAGATTTDSAGYLISKSVNGRVTVSAPDAEGVTISVTN